MNLKKLIIILFIFIAIPFVSGLEPEQIISNSADWQDVYSTMLYSELTGKSSYFLVSSRHSTLLIGQLSKSQKNTWVISSEKNPYVVSYKPVLESKGFAVEEFEYSNVNLEMARKIENITNFIVLDDSYGYNAISVAPYAVLTDSYVLFADRKNINLISNFLNTRQVESLLIYGQVDREVKERLSVFSPETINNGDRFLDNQAIVDKYQEKHIEVYGEPKTQVILTNGEFIEQEILSGVEPVVFIGRANVPDQVREYIKNSDIEIGILIGNELIGSATFIRRQLGISVFVKFAQSARTPSGPISAVEDLDRFYLPRYILSLDLYRVRYNKMNNQVYVTYQNNVALSSYLKGTITLRYEGETQTVGDSEPVFIDKNEYKTIVYDIDPVSAEQIRAEVFTIYGESRKSLEYTLRETVDVETVNILDNSEIEIVNVRYDRRKGEFLIDIKNTGNVDVFVDLELVDILINDELRTFGPEEVSFIEKGEVETIMVEVEMAEEDFENNPKVRLTAYYGERERNLVNVISGEYDYSFTGFGYLTGRLIKDIGGSAVTFGPIIIILLLLILIIGMKKKCPDCNEINSLRSKKCKRCGREI
ncbi:hypothetical protein GF327_03695 [Candidatus Woesearchaeota archaeon]|nr:hypothetical protein [Candidatus Woesearchaeota archaeon]